MAGFVNVGALVDAELNGQVLYRTWRKQPTQTTGSGIWFDLSMSPGNPVPQYYAASPGLGTVLARSTDGGLDHGGNVAGLGYSKFLRRMTIMDTTAAAVPLPLYLCDYLAYYPFLDESETDGAQALTTNFTTRYPTGAGVQMMAVVVAGQTGGTTFNVTYTNSNGVAGRVTDNVLMNSQSNSGTIITSQAAVAGAMGPFLPLQRGDTGVLYPTGIQFNGVGDVGLITLVLVKPIAKINVRGIDGPVEVDFFKDFGDCPRIMDDAYLNFICLPSGTLAAAPIHGDITCIWN